MTNPRLASRYAKSLLDLAIEKGQLEEVYKDMLWLQSAIKSNRELVMLLRSPIVPASTKQRIITAVTDGNISTMAASFNALLIRKHRESNLPEIATAFVDQYKVYKHINIVKLTTAAPVSEEVKKEIIAQVQKVSGFDNIELQEKVDESIIGGFILQIGDKLVDGSIAYDLKTIARQFDNNDFIYNVR